MKKLFFICLILLFLLVEIILKLNNLAGMIIYLILIGAILIDLEKDEFLIHSEKLLIFLAIVPITRISEFFINLE